MQGVSLGGREALEHHVPGREGGREGGGSGAGGLGGAGGQPRGARQEEQIGCRRGLQPP